MKPANYQTEIVESSGNRIMVGARQVGKTETIVSETVESYRDGQWVVVIAPRQEMVSSIQDRVRAETKAAINTNSYIESADGTGLISFVSGATVDYESDEIAHADVVCIDEANYIEQEFLFQLQHEFDGDVLLTATPSSNPHIVEMWAKHSPYWQTWQVSAYDAPHIDGEITSV